VLFPQDVSAWGIGVQHNRMRRHTVITITFKFMAKKIRCGNYIFKQHIHQILLET